MIRPVLFLCLLVFPVIVQSEICNAYLPSETGTVMEQSSFNKKGKLTGKTVQELVAIEEKGKETHYTLHQESFDKKGKSIYESDLKFKCVEDTFYIDMSSFLSSEQMSAYGEMEVSMTMNEIDLPVNAKPGQELKDGSLTMQIAGNMPMSMTITVNVVNRKVDALESITTSAGTFDCIKISQDIITKAIMTITAHSTEWYAPGVGPVRTETYNKKGKLIGYTELTRLEQPGS